MRNYKDSEYCKAHMCISAEIADAGPIYLSCEDPVTKAYKNCKVTSTAGTLYISETFRISADEAKSEENCKTSSYENCNTEGDYYNAAKRKCESMGGRLPNVLEVKQLKETNAVKNSFLRTSEEQSSKYPYVYQLIKNSGYVYPTKGNSGVDVVCVGN